MSLLTPERVPVKVYKWDDADAPALNRTAGCMMTIFKACLVTGYGTKESAGWSLAFEDMSAGIKVLRPEISPHTDFYLRLSADNGTRTTSQIYLNMTDASTGDLKLECTYPFIYAFSKSTGKWWLIATARSVWFFCEQSSIGAADKTGGYFFCGDTSKPQGELRPVFLQHTGGGQSNGYYSNIFGWRDGVINKSVSAYNIGKLLYGSQNKVENKDIVALANGGDAITTNDIVSDSFIVAGGFLSVVPGLYVPLSGSKYGNFDKIDIIVGSEVQKVAVFGTGLFGNTNIYVRIDEWVY